MPITLTTPQEAIARQLAKAIDERRAALARRLAYLGEQCLNRAREAGSYTDRTGNLRSSLGYVVLYRGQPVSPASFSGGGASAEVAATARAEAEAALQRATAEAPQEGFVLIVVAGMHYAQYVAARGYDVLDSAELLAQREVPKLLDALRLQWKTASRGRSAR